MQAAILPLWKMRTNVFVGTMQWSSPCWEPLTLQLQISLLIPVTDKENINVMSSQLNRTMVLSTPLFEPDVCSDLYIRRDIRVTAVHSFRRAPAVIAVIIAACALGCVHRQGDPTVQVSISPGGHMRVGRFAGIRLRAAQKHRHTQQL